MDYPAVYILNIKHNDNHVVEIINADLYDFIQEQIGVQNEFEIPSELLKMHKNIPYAKNIEKNVILSEESPQMDAWKHISGCSKDFKNTAEAYKSIGQMMEYAGEIDIYLT